MDIFRLLHSVGIAVHWRPTGFQYSHAKFIVIDDRLLVLSSANFSQAGFSSDRDFVLVDRAPDDVREASNIFRSDWDGIGPTLIDLNLLVSPSNARAKLGSLCARARRTLDLYAEEVQDARMVKRLVKVARRGVRVRIIAATIAGPSKRALTSAGIALKVASVGLTHLYVHAKAVIVDDKVAFVGSENLSGTSLDANRELGVLVANQAAVRTLVHTFDRDWAAVH